MMIDFLLAFKLLHSLHLEVFKLLKSCLIQY